MLCAYAHLFFAFIACIDDRLRAPISPRGANSDDDGTPTDLDAFADFYSPTANGDGYPGCPKYTRYYTDGGVQL